MARAYGEVSLAEYLHQDGRDADAREIEEAIQAVVEARGVAASGGGDQG